MAKFKSIITGFILLFISSSLTFSQAKLNIKSMDDAIPANPKVKIGKLDNGLTYYIMENKKPEKHVELRLVVHTGSLMEDDDQLGFAHFCEHMNFNGTKTFPKNGMLNFLESSGIRFGADVNASTGFEMTQFMIPVPTENPKVVDTCFLILSEMANKALYEGDEIDKERGVIVSEWRQRSNFQKRMMDYHFRKFLYGSRYLKRDVIGDTNIILNGSWDALRRYYHDWYRPGLMAVIVVGDLPVEKSKELVDKYFGPIKPLENPRKKPNYDLPDQKEPMASVFTDKQMPMSLVQVMFKHDRIPQVTYNNYRTYLTEALYDIMFNNRLQEKMRQKDAPFVKAGGQYSQYMGNKDVYMLFGILKEDNVKNGIDALLTEAYRVYQHGFTKDEFERAKKELRSTYEKAYKERDKTESARFAMEFTQNFIDDTYMPGINVEMALFDKFVPEIKLDEESALAKRYLTLDNTVIAYSGPQKEGFTPPTEDELLGILNNVSKRKIDAYTEEVVDKPLFSKQVTPGKITNEEKIDEIGTTLLTLSNGMKVILKPTDFKNDQIIFNGFSRGGTSLVPDEDYISSEEAANIINESGIGDFSATQLEKLLTGKVLNVSPYINETTEGLGGSSTPEDLETAFQLINLYFTSPRKDQDAFESTIGNLKESIKNRALNPGSALQDTIQLTLSQYNFRTMPLTEKTLGKINLDKAIEIYKKRFSNPGDFTFVFVGNFDVDKIKPFIEKYLASMKGTDKKENWKDLGIRPPKGVINKSFKKGIEPKSTVRLILSGEFNYSEKEAQRLTALVDVLRIKITEDLREDKGGIYSPAVFPVIRRSPIGKYYVVVGFTCAPKDVDMLTKAAFAQMENLKNNIEEKDLNKVVKAQLNQDEINLKKNNYWLNNLYSCALFGDDYTDILKNKDLINSLTGDDLKNTAKKYFDMNNVVKVVMDPEDSATN